MSDIKFNKCQTPIDELKVKNEDGTYSYLEDLPKEVVEQFYDFLNNVPFIRWLVSPDRPMVSELPRDDEGKVIIDVTRPPILENTDFFRPMALQFKNQGCFTKLKPNANPNSEYGKWLLEERRRAWEGYIDPSTGMWVTGDMYWMLNYCPMHLVRKSKTGMTLRTVDFPAFWDGQFFITHYILMARNNGHHAAELASRGRGKTSLGGALLSKRFLLGETSENQTEVQCLVTAADRTKLIGTNQILNVFIDDIDFCAKNAPFDNKRLQSSVQELSWQAGYKRSGSDVKYGSKNSVMGIISGVNQDKLNGSRGVLYIVEEAGIFKDLLGMYNLIRPSVEQGTSIFGQILAYGTSGDNQSNFQDFQEMIYSPNGYNMQPLDNVYDKEGQGRQQITVFYPAYLNKDDGCMDENGNSDVTKALLELLVDRYKIKYGSTDINTITKRISQYPITPQEAILQTNNALFPVSDLNERLNQLDNNPSEFDDVYTGELVQRDGKVEFNPTGDLPIRDFPTKDNKLQGTLEIFAMPQKDPNGNVFPERYILGCLKEGELVNTTSGLKPVEQITLQDKLINIEGKPVSIVNRQIYDNVDDVYTMKLAGIYDTTTFTKEHPIYSCTPIKHYVSATRTKREHIPQQYFEYNFQFKAAEQVKEGDFVKAPNIYVNECSKEELLNMWKDSARIDRKIENPLNKEDFWWLLGLIIGDGWASSNQYNIHIAFNKKEQQYIQKAKRIIKQVFNRAPILAKQKQNCEEWCFSHQTFNTFITENIGQHAINKNIPEWMKYIPKEFKQQLILGYLASDGSVTKTGAEFVSVSKKLLCDIQGILFSLGIVSTMTLLRDEKTREIVPGIISRSQKTYHLRIAKIDTLKMAEWCTDDLKLAKAIHVKHPNKRVLNIRISEDNKYIYFRILKITKEPYVGKVYNFECDTHTFVCNYFPTHNCDPIDNDKANTMSFGSMFVLDLWTDTIAAEYTGRPQFANDLYEIVRKTCLFYNAKCLYENNLHGIFSYFSQYNCTYLLADTPQYLKDRELIKTIGSGNTSKGVRATSPIIKYALKLLRDWLLKPVTKIEKDAEGNDVETSMANLYKLRNRALIKELILWNPNINVDRIMAMVQVMLYREEKMILYQGDLQGGKNKTFSSGLEEDPYFTSNYRFASTNIVPSWVNTEAIQ